MEYNGGSVIAMVGKDCVAIASDLRLGNQALGISSNFQKVRQTFHNGTCGVPIVSLDIPCDRPYLPWFARTSDGCDDPVSVSSFFS
jgi:20S proteasome subunit beta 3